jgi:hypothetical protein
LVGVESTTLIFFIFRSCKIRVNPTGIVSSFSSVRCRLSSGRHCHAAAPRHTSFLWSKNELAASASSSGNTSSHRFPSWAENKALNPHRHCRPPSSNHPTPTLHCYKKVISILTTLPTTQPRLHFDSSLARASRNQSSTHHRRSLLSSSHAHRPSI